MEFIPYGLQWIDDDDINEVVNVLKSDWITTGPRIKEFEDALSAYIGSQYAWQLIAARVLLYCGTVA